MVLCPVPAEMQGLMQCKEMFIASNATIYGTISNKKHVVTLPHNAHKVADILLHAPPDIFFL